MHTKTFNSVTPKAVDSIRAVILAACKVMAQVYAETLNMLEDEVVLFSVANGRMLIKCECLKNTA